MIQEPINAEEFAVSPRPWRKSPAACGWRQLLRLAMLMAIGFGLASLTLNPGRVLSATSDVELRHDKA
jgi:hypothetical protein